jgi:methyl-accepting chemotaxis protein
MEVDQFLTAVRDETGDLRRYERLPGNGAVARLSTSDRPPVSGLIHNISLGGIAVACAWDLPVGTGVRVELSGADGAVDARVVQTNGSVAGLVFRQDAETLARINRVLSTFDRGRKAA